MADDREFLDDQTMGRLAEAGRVWLRRNGITLSEDELVTFQGLHVPIFARLGVSLSGPAYLALLRAYQQKKRALTDQEILALVSRADLAGGKEWRPKP